MRPKRSAGAAIGSERCVPESLRLPVSLWRELALTGDLVASRDPRRILEMGFSVVRQKGGALADPLALHPGDRVEIETHSRTFEAQIDKIKPI